MLKEKNEDTENSFFENVKNGNSNSITDNIGEDSLGLKKKEDDISFEIKNNTIAKDNDNEVKDLNLIKSIKNLNEAFEKNFKNSKNDI